MEKYSIQTMMQGDVAVVTVTGRIDSETSPMLDAELTKVAAHSAKLVIDLAGVGYMSSAGIRALVKASQAAQRSGGAVKLALVPESVMAILYTVGLTQVVGAYATVGEAAESF